jgi:hypothetical protein
LARYDYGVEQLMKTVSHLAAGSGTPTERLATVARDNLIHIRPDVDLPESLRDKFDELRRKLSNVCGTSATESDWARSVRRMSPAEVTSTIDRIVVLYVALSKLAESS